MRADILTCRELVELVTGYLEGSLEAADHTRFEEHLMSCPSCRAHVDQMRGTIRLLGRVSADALSPAAERHLLEAFRGWKAG